MSIPHRCGNSKCRARVSFARVWTEYVRPKVCQACGSERFVVDVFRRRREGRKYRCSCSGYHFYHRRGSKWCVYSTSPPTDDDYLQRYGPSALEA